MGVLLVRKAQRSQAQRKLGSRLLQVEDAPVWVTVDIRTTVSHRVLQKIEALGGKVIGSSAKYRAVRARLPTAAFEELGSLPEVQFIRTADRAFTNPRRIERKPSLGETSNAASAPLAATSEGDAAHRAGLARRQYGVNGAGIGIGVISDGVDTLAERQSTGGLPERVIVLPGQAGGGDEGTAMLEIVHDLAPGAELYFATGFTGGEAEFAENVEALCAAGANVIVDDLAYFLEAAFQDGIAARGVNAAIADDCVHFSAAGNRGNLNDGTSGVWEGDFAAGSPLVIDGEAVGDAHDFGDGLETNELEEVGLGFVLQWADPLGASANDYDLFLVDADGHVLRSSTNTQDGTQDPIEFIPATGLHAPGAGLVVVKVSGEERYLRLDTIRGKLAAATAGNTVGHNAAEQAVGVAAVDVRSADGPGGAFGGSESVETFSADGPRRVFFDPEGNPITAGDFSSSGGKSLVKPDLAAADQVSTSTPGFWQFGGTSAAAPHAAAIAALMLEASGGPASLGLGELREAMEAASLDIEAPGIDRDSGSGILMAPDAVGLVAVEDRNRAPVAMDTLPAQMFRLEDDAVAIEVAAAFSDPDGDELAYSTLTSDSVRVQADISGSTVTVTPLGPGRMQVWVRATDPHGSSAVQTVQVEVSAGDKDYDSDDDRLIDVESLAQLDAIRYDLDADGVVDGATWRPYYEAFPEGALEMGCPEGCLGYELTANLDFDTNGDGLVDPADAHWNDGSGWAPIGFYRGYGPSGPEGDSYTGTFDGNGKTIANLFIHRPGENGVGLFGYVGAYGRNPQGHEFRNIGLEDIAVTGNDNAGGLLGLGINRAVVRSHVTGSVSGANFVGGLVGRPGAGAISESYSTARVTGREDGVGGLAGQAHRVERSYATGPVSGREAVGGLVGFADDEIRACYATGRVSGQGAHVSGVSVCGPKGGVGGLVGNSCADIVASYATGTVSGENAVGGLAGTLRANRRGYRSYWDLTTSGVRVGVGSDDANSNGRIDAVESESVGVVGQATARLQMTDGYHGIFATWNLDFDSDYRLDEPWHFGNSDQYPVLAVDKDGDGQATWEEFGYQLRTGPTLDARSPAGQARVNVSWNAVDAGPWEPAPRVTYRVTRDDGADVQTMLSNAGERDFTDTDVSLGAVYTYQVAAIVSGGEAVRSAPVSVKAGTANRLPTAEEAPADWTLRVNSMPVTVDVAGAFGDGDGDELTYDVSSSSPSIVSVSVSGSQVTIEPVAGGVAVITVTATDPSGSNTSISQRFRVTVWPDATIDYDLDDDGLIEITALEQLDAVRHDLNGDGAVDSEGFAGPAGDADAHAAAFPDAAERMGCGVVDGCLGYELLEHLDFDTDGSGIADAGDEYWNDGAGWVPIGGEGTVTAGTVSFLGRPFSATFDGGGHTIANLFISRELGDYTGLFGFVENAIVRNVVLTGLDVKGARVVGGLVGLNWSSMVDGGYVRGRVSGGATSVGGLVGENSAGAVSRSRAIGNVTGGFGVGGLVGRNTGSIRNSFATADAAGGRSVGGLAGTSWFGEIIASYASGRVSGSRNVGGLLGFSLFSEVNAGYATGSVTGAGQVGGLIGFNVGIVRASYATATVAGDSMVGGLIGENVVFSKYVEASYWDVETSGLIDGPGGKTTSELQAPTDPTGIFADWHLDVDGDGTPDRPWRFGSSGQYPALAVDLDGDGHATWEEFGYQLRTGPGLTATPAEGVARVDLRWAPTDTSYWSPPPTVTYRLYRGDGDEVEVIADDYPHLQYTDDGMPLKISYTYRVASVVSGGEASRSGGVEVSVAADAKPPFETPATLAGQRIDVDGGLEMDISSRFRHPEARDIGFSAESSNPEIVSVELHEGLLTVRGLAPGRATVTVTAEDSQGGSASLLFVVIVGDGLAVPLFPSTLDTGRRGFVRVINRSSANGGVRIEAVDDTGRRFGPVTLDLPGGATSHFNSGDLEMGSSEKGLSGGVGTGTGDWRLELESELDIEVLSYVRTEDGFLTAMHDAAPANSEGHRVVTFNPGSNRKQRSRLRIVNPDTETAEVAITGIDDRGMSPGSPLRVRIPAGAAVSITAAQLEAGAGGDAGALGDGSGKWRLRLISASPLIVMNLLESPSGHLTNLSTTAAGPDEPTR